jgi:molybdenum cofactor synthesis domain-containing protein
MIFSVGILTISDKGAAGHREDQSGLLLCKLIETLPGKVACYEIVPDEKNQISEKLRLWCDEKQVSLVLTTGGTGPAPRDITPEATKAIIERDFPGLAEALRLQGYAKNPKAILSRGVAGIRGKTLIVNLPGSPNGVEEGFHILLPILPHAMEKIAGDECECG